MNTKDEISELIEREVKNAYVKMTDNHPTIHSNRFPTWEQLSQETRNHYKDEYTTTGKINF